MSIKSAIKRHGSGFFWGTVNGDGNVYEGLRECRERYHAHQAEKKEKH